MTTLRSILLAVCVAVPLSAQSTLTTTFAYDNGQSGNMFDVRATNPQGVTIESFDVHLGPSTYSMAVYVRNGPGSWVGFENDPGAWTQIGYLPAVVSAGLGQPTTLPIPVCTYIPSGETRAFYVTVAVGTGMRWTNGTAVGALAAGNADLELYEGCAKSVPFNFTWQPAIWNGRVRYRVGQQGCTPVFATEAAYGSGCGANEAGDAQYEQFDAGTFDLSNTGHTYTWNGSGYELNAGAAAFAAPAAPATPLADEQLALVALGFAMPCPHGNVTTLFVSSNGFLSWQDPVHTGSGESLSALLGSIFPGAGRLAFLWDDLDPSQAGSVHFEQVAANTFHVTFVDVPEAGTSNTNTVQVALHASGDIEVRYGNCAVQDCLVGISPGHDANDLGGTDYSALTPSSGAIIATGVEPFFDDLELSSGGAPVLGGSWQLTTRNFDPAAPLGVTYFGPRAPAPLPLDPLGAPGCVALLQSIFVGATGTAPTGSMLVSLAIPNTGSLAGLTLAAQTLGLTLGNAANFATSNGLEGTFGY